MPALKHHGMAHQAADTAISVEERVNIVETMVRGGIHRDARADTYSFEPEALLKMLHEGEDAFRGRRRVATDADLVIDPIAEFARSHTDHALAGARSVEHGVRLVLIE